MDGPLAGADAGGESQVAEAGASSAPDGAAATFFRLLADDRRRYLLHCLRTDGEGEIRVETLVQRVVDRETDSDEPADDDRPERVAASLHHVHLPKLADAGLVEYDPDDGTVRIDDSVEEPDSDDPNPTGTGEDSAGKRRAVRHAETALAADDAAEVDYHLRETLQLLTVD